MRPIINNPVVDIGRCGNNTLYFGHTMVITDLLKVYFFVFFLFGLCVRADPAADLAAFDELGFLRTLLAAVAAFFDVVSLRLAILRTPYAYSLTIIY